MASTSCFLHHHALTTTAASSRSSSQRQVGNIKPTQLVCRAQKQVVQDDDGSVVSRRLALTVLIGAAALGSKVSPADAAYGESGNYMKPLLIFIFVLQFFLINICNSQSEVFMVTICILIRLC